MGILDKIPNLFGNAGENNNGNVGNNNKGFASEKKLSWEEKRINRKSKRIKEAKPVSDESKNEDFLFSGRQGFLKRKDTIKELEEDKKIIPGNKWKPPIKARIFDRKQRKELAEKFFSKEKFGRTYISKKKFEKEMKALKKQAESFKNTKEKFEAKQYYDYLREKTDSK